MTYANHCSYSDITPYEVVRVISDTTLEIRALRTEALPWDRQWAVGGFAATLTNQRDQQWAFASDATLPTERIRRNKKGEWRNARGTFRLDTQPVKFYDYNF